MTRDADSDAASGRPRVGVSSCLLGAEVRFNGGHKRCRFLTDELDPYVDWVPYCPEVEIGLGTPREPIQLRVDGRLVSRSGAADHTAAMTALPLPADLDGYVFKAKSPSCGVRAVPRYRDDGEASGSHGRGLYAERVIARFPLLAVEEMTEVGVDRIMPWAAARCVSVWHGERAVRSLARWRVTAREAAKQSRRAWIPEVTQAVSAADVAEVIAKAACAIVLDPEAPDRLGGLRPPESGDLLVILGPEGGITDDESMAFRAAGATARRLGPTVLRTSTAGPVAAAVLLSRSGRW